MKNNEIDLLWKEFNELEVEELLHFSGEHILNKLSQIASGKQKEVFLKEFDLAFNVRLLANQLEHFEPDSKQVSQHVNEFVDRNKNNYDYFLKRHNEVKTIKLKWQYLLACYFIQRDGSLVKIIELVIDSSKLALTEKSYLNCVLLLVLAFNLNKLYGTKLENMLNSYVLEIIDQIDVEPRFLFEPITVLAKLNKIGDEKITKLIDLLFKNAEKESKINIKQQYYRIAILLCENYKIPQPDTKISILLKLAEMFENQGDKEVQAMLKIHNYEQSIKEYQKLNNDKKISELNIKIRESTGNIEYTELRHEMKIPKMKIPGKSGFEKVVSISNFVEMIPSYGKTEQLVKELKKEHPISFLFTHTKFSKQQPVSHSSTDDEIFDSSVKTQLVQAIQITELVLSVNVNPLEKNGTIKIEDYLDYIESFGLHNKTSLAIIERGLNRHYEGDYISSIHNLIPRIEYTHARNRSVHFASVMLESVP